MYLNLYQWLVEGDMDSTIIAAIIGVGAGLLGVVIAIYFGRKGNEAEKKQEDIENAC